MRRTAAVAVLVGSVAASAAALFASAPPARAQLSDILLGPKTLIDRAIEARSTEDIAKDNEIVIKVNKVMADLGTIKASTEIYEQALLVTGMFNDADTYRKFENGVRNVKGIKRLYWHVTYMTDKAEKAAKESGKLMDWADVLVFGTKAKARLIGTAGVADVNFRVAADGYGNLYLLGRARSNEELRKALARLNDGDGVRKVYNYAVVRP